MHYTHMIFDLDGTLTDPKVGITKAITFALDKMGEPIPDMHILEDFIGPPLFDSFIEMCGLSPSRALKAVEYYREYYSHTGLYENHPYPGIEDALKALKEDNIHMYVATSKPEVYAKKILTHFGLSEYFDCIAGATLDGTITKKEEVLDYLSEKCQLADLGSVLMVGDRKFDIQGARHAGFDAAAVLYGYGSQEELESHSPEYLVSAPGLLPGLRRTQKVQL
jgi:phosphoglycolate phosphatase